MYSWDEIYERADGAACGEPALRAKDEARHQVRCMMLDAGKPDPDDDEIPEETIEDICDWYGIKFDKDGNIVRFDLPDMIAEAVYRQVDDGYIKQDIINAAEELFSAEVSDEQIDEIMRKYRHDEDCNVPYNETIENSIREVLKREEI